jgi:hypothetical protein
MPQTETLTGKFYIVLCDSTSEYPDVDSKNFIVGEFYVEQHGQFEEKLFAALDNLRDEILDNVTDPENLDPGQHICIVPHASFIPLKDLVRDPVLAFYLEDDVEYEEKE